jgi:kumamolisin
VAHHLAVMRARSGPGVIPNRVLTVLALGILLLTACSSPATTKSYATDWFHALLETSTDRGPVDANQRVSLSLVLRDPTKEREEADLRAIYDPASPNFARFKTPSEFAAAYGPPTSEVDALRAYFGRGLDVEWQPGSRTAVVAGPARSIEAAFGVRIHAYVSSDGVSYYASALKTLIPAAVQRYVVDAGQVSSYRPPLVLHSVPAGGLKPADILAAYDMKPLRDDLKLDGAGETVVFWSLSDGFRQSDFDLFSQQNHLPQQDVTVVGPTDNPGEGETIMDLEVVHSIAPAARLVVYTGAFRTDEDFKAIHQHIVGDNPGAIISHSWGECERGQTADSAALTSAYDQAAQQGGTVFVSTGDSGAFGCLTNDPNALPTSEYIGVSLPASVPGVTAVGGTHLSVRQDGSWYNEVVWMEAPQTGGTGGGVSTLFPRPQWQQAAGVDNQFNRDHMRSIPDVSADADPYSGMAIYDSVTGWGQGGGTSQSAPIWAGITALINQYLKSKGLKPVGFLNPALYALARGNPPFPPFHDIVVGSDLVHPATPGYDLATGLGSPDVWNLARDLEAYQRKGGRI